MGGKPLGSAVRAWLVPIGALVALLLVIILAGACGNGDEKEATPTNGGDGASPPAGEDLVIGLLGPVSGDAAVIGEQMTKPAKLAIKEINAAGGICNRQVRLEIRDDQADPAAGVAAAKDLVSSGDIAAIIGPAYSGVTQAVGPILKDANIFSLAGSGSSALRDPEAFPYGFETYANTDFTAAAIVNYAADSFKADTIGIISDTTEFSRALLDQVQPLLEQAGVQVVEKQDYTLHDPDMTTQMSALKQANPDLLFASPSDAVDAAKLMGARKNLGWDVTVIGPLELGQTEGVQAAGADAFKNVYTQAYANLTYETGKEPLQRVVDFVKKMRAEYGESGVPSIGYSAQFYDSPYILKLLIEKAGCVTDGPTLAQTAENDLASFEGVTATYSGAPGKRDLYGAEALTMASPVNIDEWGLQERAPGR